MHNIQVPLLSPTEQTGRIISTYTGRSYSSKIRVDCKSSNLIYCITCKHCSTQYVGQTKRRLMDRFQGHLYNITSRNVKDTIGHHFNQCDHHGISHLELHIVDFIHAHPESPQAFKLRRTIERNWQHRLRTIAPQGLNIQEWSWTWDMPLATLKIFYWIRNTLGPLSSHTYQQLWCQSGNQANCTGNRDRPTPFQRFSNHPLLEY